MSAEVWASGAAYEPYVGRWSRLVAAEFLAWIGVPAQRRWLDVGSGTGALTETILGIAQPAAVTGVDSSAGYVEYARAKVHDPHARFDVADATALPFAGDEFDVTVSGLVLNFIPRPEAAAAELARVTRAGGTVAAYVWDYAGDMQLMRYFWDAAAELDSAAGPLVEGVRFPLCRPEPLRTLFEGAGLSTVETRAIDVPTHFRDFDDYWTPFLGGQGPAPAYAMSVTEDRRAALREHIRARLPHSADGSIPLIARAWAVRGTAGGRP
jgi:SAM-dependent methyltransferase